jgi:deoxycytidylate deaminase
VLGAGVNGFPKGMDDVADEFRHHLMIHAEVNALLACRDQVHNVYVYPYMPCSKCASLLVQIGAKRFISVQDAAEHWRPELTALLANRYLIERVWITEEELDDTMIV